MRKKTNTQKKHVVGWTKWHFAFIDEHPKKPHAKRVNAILELLVAIRTEKRFWEKAELIHRLKKAFRRYRWVREIIFVVPGNKQSERARPIESVISARRARPRIWTNEDDWNHSDDYDWEYGAVGFLLFLAEHYPDYLSKIQRCTICNKWMLVLKSNQRFCSGKCRQFEYDNDPERIEQHRANMRRLYRLERYRAGRAKSAVAFSARAKNKQKKSLSKRRHTL